VLHTGQKPAFEGFTSGRKLADDAWSPGGDRVALAGLRGRPVTALAGIANPQAFFGCSGTAA
jgi:tetraacyldisaccharide 4'-kinase